MREILYRGKGKCETVEHHKGDWLFGDYARLKDGKTTMHFIYGQCEIDIATLGQYTGLKDKNGIKIFEGDILRADNGHIGCVAFGVLAQFGKYCKCHKKFEPIYPDNETVIGNIHDNPELVEGEQK